MQHFFELLRPRCSLSTVPPAHDTAFLRRGGSWSVRRSVSGGLPLGPAPPSRTVVMVVVVAAATAAVAAAAAPTPPAGARRATAPASIDRCPAPAPANLPSSPLSLPRSHSATARAAAPPAPRPAPRVAGGAGRALVPASQHTGRKKICACVRVRVHLFAQRRGLRYGGGLAFHPFNLTNRS